MNVLQMMLIIFVINIVYVSIFTMRIILVMKAQKLLAAGLSMIEVLVYLIGLNLVLNSIDDPFNLLAYCIGYGTGVWLGGKIEEWLALGYVTLQIVVDQEESRLPVILREKGFGVTSWTAEGKDGLRLVMQVLAKRSNESRLYRQIHEISPRAFVISYEPRFFRGGFWTKRLK
jgi:uncharacterized protein YebE (UPF0316 family)